MFGNENDTLPPSSCKIENLKCDSNRYFRCSIYLFFMSDRELLSAELNFHDARAEKVTFCALESMNLGRTEKCNGFR
ncbi:uncharacterized protein PHALS_02396 [Plasmopara halstedii]|uniref:Uncharacterized protein n=1 Tax=Plasmopara halstedii TaxID=4781 RepID=A0A0P1AYV8_PLAHL|nr:uncharacterized protein PHALS_02396 [Plasmopara halstedii]CEG46074.1 hypothetical protein PHALS_02396 [Plasmopara halstedii]|eukprot:XP_024582443.1 hypothetical protein PHALS_02396 [Plasmopara halstedii]